MLAPSRAIAAHSGFRVDLNLWDADADASPDDEVSHGHISWRAGDEYDRQIQAPIKGRYGQATVAYVVMSDAVEARVEVVLVNGDGESPADIYGKISVSSKFVQRDLFYKESTDYIGVYPGNAIKLSRAILAVPKDDRLRVHADLVDHDSDASSNDQVAKGYADFHPKVSGKDSATIRGEYGEIRVTVTWS
ncbi:hypothetical protein CDD83_1239 [Cordyceps sp. RAO-2017]|nr:hypothetical protein CDD83_1239 [Cordyceps sp. RAO-2017]